ncbi:protocadherin Fat 1-like [Littorina saxatilis]|uniref:protocadherin Fat 1-like n=1 Tax=Littorina saxatilis TaxID=31220 RepID=UPI0038B65FB8
MPIASSFEQSKAIARVRVNHIRLDSVQFRTTSSVRGDYYSIDPFTGYVSLARSLLNTTHNADLLNLQVTDMRDGNERTDSADLTVNIIRSPRFTNLPEQTTVERSAAVNTVVYTVSATDGNSVGEINYKLEGNYPALSYFVVDRVSGAVTMNTTSLLADSLLLESYQLEFLAYNTVYPTNQATSTLTIVIDRNPNAPTCDTAGVAITVDPQTLPGAVVATVTATDPESNSLRYSFAQADQETRDQFFIAADTGNIILRKAIGNLPPNKVFNFTVEASDQGQPRAKNCTTRVQFTLGSDEPPVFYSNNSPTTTYTWNINETAFQNGARFTSVSARDTDLQGQLIFKAIGDLRAPYFFSVDNITAAVTVRNDVRDSDLETSYKLLITAYDSLRPTTLATSTVMVTVDRNPSAPAVQNINVTIEELTPVSTIIANVTASDSDGDTLEYSLEGTAVSVAGLEYFWINPTTGSVRVMKPITQDTTDNERYEMTVTVRDRATPQKSAQASVIVHVLRDDFPPVFMNTPYTTDISENTLAISSIFTVSADDPDLREQLVYEKIGDDEAVYFFDVDRLNGTIYLVNGLLTDNKTSYTLRVQAYDTAYPEQKTSVTVQIQVRRNEYSPVFAPSPITVTIEETVQIGSVITIVNATDQDARDTLRYSSESDTGTLEALQLFDLNPDSGAVRVRASLLNLPRDQYIMQVRATDDGIGQKSGTVTVFISINRHPGTPVLSPDPCGTSVGENTAVGTTVLTLTAADNNSAGSILYTVEGDYPAGSIFNVTATGQPGVAVVTTNVNLRYNTMGESTYNLRLVAYDSARTNRRDVLVCTINVARNQNGPQWNPENYIFEIPENQPYISNIGNVSAFDVDPDDVVSYRILSETEQRDSFISGPSKYFQVDSNTGQLNLVRSVRNTNINSFALLLEACDNGLPRRCVNVTVQVNVNRTGQYPVCHYPPTSSSFVATILESATSGSFVMRINASDDDAKGGLVYELVYPYPIALSINTASGDITLEETIDDDQEKTVDIEVLVYDPADPGRQTRCNGTIFITRNLYGPFFSRSPYRATISEYHIVSDQVVTINAADRDGDPVVYNVIGASPNDTTQLFYLDPSTGVIILRKSLEGTERRSYNLTVEAVDDHPFYKKKDITNVYITVELDQTPFFQPTSDVALLESQSVDSVVGQMTAGDNDLRGVITYELVGDYPGESLFSVNSTTGEIRLARDLKADPDQLATYTLRLIAYDSARPKKTVSTTVMVRISRNPNVPVFQPSANYIFTISETAALGNFVGNISATDNDNDKVTYRIQLPNDDGASTFFLLDSERGEISVRKPLTETPLENGLQKNVYNFTVQAFDGRGNASSASVQITIGRVAIDRQPVFTSAMYNITIYQNVSSSIGSLDCTDPDLTSPENDDRIRYRLLGYQPADRYFAVNNQTGQVSLKEDVTGDPTQTQTYTLVVECYDRQNPDLTAQEVVVISVNRNPNCPVFNSAAYSITINENFPVNTFVVNVSASDADGDIVSYFIDEDSAGLQASRYFFVSSSTGEIYVKNDLRSGQGTYTFTVSAYDNRSRRCRTPASVTIRVEKDAGSPTCPRNNQIIRINETTLINSTQVHLFQAQDSDTRGDLRFSPTGDALAWAYFQLFEDGRVTVRRSLRTTLTTRFELFASVYDTYFPSNSGTCSVIVEVAHNVGVPTFTSPIDPVQVFEYDPSGSNFLNVTATDPDNDQLTYSIRGDPEDDKFFTIDGRTGRISLLQDLSYSNTSLYTFEVLATDSRLNVSNTGTSTVTVSVVRDTPPTFTDLPTSVQKDEDAVQGEFVYQINADDTNKMGSLVYTAVGNGAAPSMFHVNSTGYVSVNTNLTLDPSTTSYELAVTVHDSAVPDKRTTSTLTISVDRNPNPPVFTLNEYTKNITINTNVGDVVATITATDVDGDVPTYSITGGSGTSYFVLNAVSGDITLVKPLDATTTQLSLNVRATDRPIRGLTDDAVVNFNVRLTPILPSFNTASYNAGTILETRPTGSTVYSLVSATDNDLQGNLTYAAEGIYPADNFFHINPVSGVITVKNNLTDDALSRPVYELRVIAYDSAFPDQRATSTVTIGVTHNPNAPRFSDTYRRIIPETWAFNESIFNISANDGDGDTLAYELIRDNNGRSGLDYFYIQPQTGTISIWRRLTQAPDDEYSLKVRVTDSGRPARFAEIDVTIGITRVTVPSFSRTNNTVTVPESRGVDVFVYEAFATIPTGSIKYRLTGEGQGPYYFKINENTGRITVARNLRTGRDMSYTLLVEAYDDAFPDAVGKFTLTVDMTRNDNAPVLTGPYTANINETTNPGALIMSVTATDGDGDQTDLQPGRRLGLSEPVYIHPCVEKFLWTESWLTETRRPRRRCLATPQGFEDNLEIITENVSGHEYQCNVRVISPFNRDIVPFLDIVILATEQKTRNNYSEEAVLRLVIIPNNQNPPTLTTTSGSFEGYILENSAVGTLVSNDTGLRGPLRLLVTDRDVAPGDPPGNYEITLDPFNGFHVDDSGYIQFREGTLDYETKRIYILNATVRELDTVERLTGSATLTIHVLDVNVPSVPSDLLRVTVPERDYSGVGQFLVSLNASEIEGGDSSQLNYTIKDVYPDGLAGMFRINASGGVFLQGAVSAGDSFTLQTEVSGLGHTDQTASVAVIVDVTPDGNQPPKFTANNYTIYVSEAVPVQSSLWNIPATDPEGDDLTYTITSSDPMNDFNTLNVSSNSHILRNTVNLDRERVERYIMVLRAEDTGGNSATATVTVIVLDVNDNSPMFNPTEYNFTIDENQNSGTVVGSVMANDTDKASTTFSNVSYSIEPENNDFNVNSESGQITSLRPFDYEKDKIFTFTVLATDGGGNIGVARVIVRVRDLQDNIPVFDRNYTFYVDEGVSGAIVGQVTATDMDTTDNIQYQFDSGESGNFSIDGTTGEIRTIPALDYNVKNQYIFTVTTSDGSAIDPSTSSTVTVIVNDVNNFTPVITITPNNTVYLLENANASTVVVDVNADDGDSQNTSSGRIIFSIESSTPGSGRPYFTIDPVSGVLTVAGSLKEAPEDLFL